MSATALPGSLGRQVESSRRTFASCAIPRGTEKTTLDWAIARAREKPAPNTYSLRGVGSGGKAWRISKSNPPSYLETIMREARSLPGPNTYDVVSNNRSNIVKGGKFSDSVVKGFIDRETARRAYVPSPSAYSHTPQPASGGTFSEARPKSDIDWKVYDARQKPSAHDTVLNNEYIVRHEYVPKPHLPTAVEDIYSRFCYPPGKRPGCFSQLVHDYRPRSKHSSSSPPVHRGTDALRRKKIAIMAERSKHRRLLAQETEEGQEARQALEAKKKGVRIRSFDDTLQQAIDQVTDHRGWSSRPRDRRERVGWANTLPRGTPDSTRTLCMNQQSLESAKSFFSH
jgi:hypothetical protein